MPGFQMTVEEIPGVRWIQTLKEGNAVQIRGSS
jgi:hypothetical protein